MEPPAPGTTNPRGFAGPLLLLSVAVLAQELLLVRLLAVPLWNHITYMVVTSALLAFGVAGTLLAVFPRLGGTDAESGRRWFAVHCLLFAAATFVTGQSVASAEVDTLELLQHPQLLLDLFGLYLLVGLPLLFAGLAVTCALRHAGAALPRAYFANLLGSGAGCAVFLALLQPLTGPGLLMATAALGAIAGAWAGGRRIRIAGAAVALVALAAVVRPEVRSLIVPEPQAVKSKDINDKLARGHRVEMTLWNPLCRIDVTGNPAEDPQRSAKYIFQDGDAPTFLYPPGADEAMETTVPYLIHPEARSILVIGAGGGRELALAAKRGLRRIVGVEINAATVSLLNGPYRAFTGDIVGQPGVELVNAEGRSWLARSPERFDFIQMTGVDTYAALNSGAYVASESYLYTEQAFDDYLAHLKDDGYFSIIRLFFAQAERETLRLFVMALKALERLGVAEPQRHVLVVKTGQWGILVVGRSPIPEARVAAIRDLVQLQARQMPQLGIGIYYDPYAELATPFTDYVRATAGPGHAGEEAFFDGYPYNVRPVSDDSPFFYLYHHWGTVVRRLLGRPAAEASGGSAAQTPASDANAWLANTGEVPAGQYVLLGLLVQAVLVGLVLVLGPLAIFRRRALTLPGTARSIAYFGCLGLGFMLLEIALAQKFSLFLGHPTRSLAVVIGGMLVFSGLGSLVSGRWSPHAALRTSTLLVAILAAALAVLLPRVTGAWLQAEETARVLIALAVLAPLSFAMGMPMPSGLRLLGARGADLVPWAWGVNGVASVLGSVLAIVLAMSLGFTGVLLAAAALYVAAAVAAVR